jgi:gliding motility-associated-like protein
MVHKIKFFLIIFLCFFLTEGFAITYYVSQDGNDAKDGKSPANAWKTINKVNNVRFGRGDVILFRRGDTFRGTIILDNPLARSMYNLTFGAYGTGNLPIISGSTHVTNWRLFRDNIYVADNVNSKVSKVFINKQEMTLARFPNHDTFLYMDEGSNSNSFIDLDADLMQFPASVIIGSNCRSRTVDWSIETRQVGAFNNGTFTLASPFHYNNKKGNGYFLDNKIEYLDTEGEWFYDEVAKKLYVIAPNNIDPNQLLVEASILEHGFHNPSANAFLHNFIFENLRFEEQSTDGLLISRATNLIIRNVEFHGQGFDGIEVNASGGLIENCKFTHIHGKGIRISGSNNRIIKNIFKKIGMRPEYTIRAIANSAISTHISSSSQILIQSNIIDSVGYIGIDAAGSNHIVEKNIVSNACMSIDDGGGIYVFGATSVGTIIRNNIVKNLLGNRNGSPNAHTLAIGIYVDNYCSNITVENNTIINAKGEGIRLNSLASNCKVINNTVYDAKDADLRIRTAAGEASGSMGHTVSGNVLYGLDKDDLPMMVNGYVGSDFPGVFDRNYYVNPYNSLIIRKDELNMGSVRHSLAGWQARHRQDMNGKTSFYKLNTWIVTDTLSKNFIPNGNFSSGVAGWSRWPNDNNTITWDRTTFPQGGMNISVNSVTRVDYAYIFTRDVFSFKQGSYYQLSFDVGAIRNGTIIVSSRTNGGSTIINLNQSVAVSSNIEKVNIVFQAASTTMADFAFNVPISTGTIWVDNVVLQEIKVSPDDPKQRNPIFVNETNQTQTFSLGSLIHYDLDNNEVVNTITVPAYSSRILVRTDKPVPPPQKITAFSLLDSANRVIKAGLTNNDTIDFNKIRANNLFIRATTNPPVVGSIRFSANANTVNDNQAPYLFPFSNKQYKGNTNLTVTPHTLADGLGRVGEIANLNLIFVNRNVIPVANAGLDQNITLPTNSITINGAGTDADGSITRFLWTKVSGGNATLSNINFPNLIVSGLSVGTYVFRLTVTDNDAVTNSDDVQVTVHPALTNITRFEVFNVKTKRSSNFTNNSTINFSTLGTDSVYIRAIPSTLVNNIIFNFNNANSTVTESPYQILLINRQLTGNQTLTAVPTDAQNRQGNTATLNFSIQNRQNINPVANAGSDKSITLPINTISLQGTGIDTDGRITKFEWTKVSGGNATLVNANTANLTVNDLTVGTYVFRLTVTDNENATHSDEVQVTVNSALASITQFSIINPRNNQSIGTISSNSVIDFAQLGIDSVFVRAIPSTPVNSVAFNFNNATISRNTAPYQILLINRQLTGNQTLTAVPTDTQNRQGNTATLNFSIQNRQNINPVANAGNDRSITLPTNTIALQGSGIDADGRITKFEWTKVSGGNATLANANTATLNASNLAVGIYVFRLTVTDNDNATHSDEVQVTVNNALASISRFELFNPRTNQIIGFNNNSIIDFAQLGVDSVFVRAIPSTALNSVAFNFNNATISRNTAPYQILLRNRQLTGNQTLTAVPTDTQNRQGNTATLNFSIQNRQNTNPVANAGNDRSITIPTNTIILQGIGTDTDGSVASFAWTQVSGNPVTLANANTANLTVNNLLEGTYLFRLTVTDNENATHSDEVQVTVSRPTLRVTSLNIINANTNAQIAALREGGVIDFNTLGTDRIFIRANVLSPVGSLVFDLNGQKTMENFAPYEIIINNRQINGAQTLTVTPFSERNGLGLSGNAFVVNFSVINRLNLVPIVNAGADQTITLPTSSINLIGQVSDADGTIANHVWTKISGGAATLTNPNFNTLTVSGLQQGSYVFRLTATDNEGGIGSDEVSINVIMPSLTVSAVNLVNNQNQTIRTLSNNATIDFNTLAGDVVYLRASVQPANLIGSVVFTINGQTIVKDGAPFEIALRNGDFQGNTTITITPYSQTGGKGTAGSPTNLQFQVINRNLLPIVSAGSNQTITQPTSNATLSGRATDSDGQIVRTVWRQISGNKAIIADSTKLSTSINQLSVGEYTFRLLATDNRGGIGSADVQITVRPEPMSIIQIVLINPINNTQVGILTNNSVIDFGALKLQKVQLRAVIQPANVGSVIFNHNRVNKIQNFAPYDISIDNGGTVINHTLTVTPYRNTNGQGEAGQGLSFNFSVRNRVNQAPTIQVANIHSITLPVNNIIINATANDTDGSISSYVWSQINGASNAILLNTNTANLTANNLVQGTYLFRLTVTDNERATANADVTVTVLPPASIQRPETLEPNPIVTLVVRGDVLCNGGKARLVAKGAPSNASYAWFAQPQGGNPIARQADSVWTTSFISTTTDYYVAAMINDKELTQSRVKVTATINAAPIAQIQQGSTIEFCESGELSAVSVSNSTVEWYFNKAVVSKSEKFVVTQSGVYTLKVRRNGCEATSTPINVTIQKSFEAIIAQGESVSFLANGQISANPVPSASYEWFNAENQLIGNTLTLRVDKSGAYRVRITKGKCVVTSKAINVNIIEAQKPIIMPALSIVATRNVCEGGKLSLSANDIKDAVYQWTGPNGFQQNGNHIEVAYSNKLITGYYKLKVSLLGKEANDSIFVNVSKGFNINVITEQPICYGDNGGSVKLNALSKQEFTFVLGNQQIKGTEAQFSALKAGDYQIKAIDIVGCEKVFNISIKNPAPINLQVSKDQVITLNNYAQLQASGADAYRWEPSEGLDNPMSPNPIAKPSQTTTYKVTGTTNNGCSVTKEVTVYVSSEEVVFAKVLSPNNDGVNDMWTIKNLEKYPNNYLAVYDVYGGIVYESTNYQNNWDGTNSRGFLPDGAYFFTLKINDLAGGEGKIFSGTINLHR